MSSRRDLKKNINETIDSLLVDCFLYKDYVVGADKDAADKLIIKIVNIQIDFTSRISVNEGKDLKGRTRKYFRKLKDDFRTKIDEIGQEIAVLP